MSQLQFCRYQATLGNVVVTFWATADGEIIGPQGRRVDASLGATTTSEPETLPSELFAGQDVGENLRCGNVWEAVPALITSLGPLLDRLCAPLRRPPRVLELGAGMGLPGLWAAARGAEVVLTDSNLAVLELLERNARLLGEGAPAAVAVRALDWSALPDWIDAEFDLVIASDVLYDRAAIEPFLGVVAAALKPGGTLLVSHTDRGIVSFDEAIQHAQLMSLSWTAEASGGKGGGLGESIAVHTFEKDF